MEDTVRGTTSRSLDSLESVVDTSVMGIVVGTSLFALGEDVAFVIMGSCCCCC